MPIGYALVEWIKWYDREPNELSHRYDVNIRHMYIRIDIYRRKTRNFYDQLNSFPVCITPPCDGRVPVKSY